MKAKDGFEIGKIKQRKFSLLGNFLNSWNGLIEVSKNEKPMQAELMMLAVGTLVVIFLEMGLIFKLILFTSLFFPLFAELVNSAIERVVDLVTTEYHTLAKHAKDAASAAVLLSLVITALVWVTVLYYVYMKV